MERGLGRVIGQQQPGGLEGLPHSPGRVEPWRDGECHRLEVDGARRDPSPLEEGGDAGPRCRPEPLETQPRDGAVLADDRGDVGDGPDGREVRQVQRGGDPARLIGQEQLGDLECHAAAGQPPVRVGRIRSMRVDDRKRRRHDRGDAVVVGHDDVDAARVGDGHLGHARRAAIHGHDDARTGRDGRIDRGERQAVALVQTARDVRIDGDAEPAQGDGHDRQPGQAVGIEVAEHEDPLTLITRSAQPGEEEVRVGQARSGHEGHRAGRRTRP